MSLPPETVSRLENLLEMFKATSGTVAVLSGAGISAESGIPTFRGPQGYWRAGSREYRPEQMATLQMFQKDPWEVWSWYLFSSKPDAVVLDVNPEPNPFRTLAERHPNGLALTGTSDERIPAILEAWRRVFGREPR